MGTGHRNDHQRGLFNNSVQYLLTAPKGGIISLSVYTFEGKLQGPAEVNLIYQIKL
jgi:hypothetical protein